MRAGSILVVLNLSTEVVEYYLPDGMEVATGLMIESEKHGAQLKDGLIVLQPYSGALYRFTG
jgi:hypothetical protein